MQAEYSDVQLFVRPIGPQITHDEVEEFFSQVGPLKELRLMPGYAFIEYETSDDAQRAFSEFLDKPFMGETLQIEYAKQKPEYAKKGENRVKVSNLPAGTAWQDFKDFIREEVRLTPTFVRIPIDEPTVCHLEFASREDLDSAISQLNGVSFRETPLEAEEDTSPYIASASRSFAPYRGRGRGRGRGGFRGDFYGGRGRGGFPPRGGYAPRGSYPPRGGYAPRGGYPPRGEYYPPREYAPRGDYPPREYAPRGDYPPMDGPGGPPRGDYPPREGFIPRGGRGTYPPRGGYAPRGGYRDYAGDRGFRDGAPPPREYRSTRDGPSDGPGYPPSSGDRDYARERSPARY